MRKATEVSNSPQMRVWILGAGFSRRLGGPLLGDLLSEISLHDLRHRHPETWLSRSACEYCVLGLREGIARGWWSNAEDYISAIGSGDATHAHNLDFALKAIPIPELEYQALREPFGGCDAWQKPEETLTHHCWTTAIGIVAAQCMDFLERSKLDPEGWLCYDRWVKSLSEGDVLVTFNYDEVVEQVFLRNRKDLWTPNPRKEAIPAQLQARQTLLKLHGGVAVRDTILYPPEPDSIANLERNPAMLAVPGRSKCDECSTEYDQLWDLASSAIRECEAVSIVGYSCPASDEMAKAMLIDSLASNKNKPIVDVVLGNDSQAASRLEALLGSLSQVRNTRLFAQDYLSLHGAGQGWQTSDVFPSDFPDDS